MLRPVRRKGRVLPFAIIAILFALNAALIAMLWSQRHVTVEPAAPLPASTPPQMSPAEVESSSGSPSPSPSQTESADQEVVVPTRLLLATSAKEAWRASVGKCQKLGRVEHSVDGGKSWRRAVKPALGPIVGLGVESN